MKAITIVIVLFKLEAYLIHFVYYENIHKHTLKFINIKFTARISKFNVILNMFGTYSVRTLLQIISGIFNRKSHRLYVLFFVRVLQFKLLNAFASFAQSHGPNIRVNMLEN